MTYQMMNQGLEVAFHSRFCHYIAQVASTVQWPCIQQHTLPMQIWDR